MVKQYFLLAVAALTGLGLGPCSPQGKGFCETKASIQEKSGKTPLKRVQTRSYKGQVVLPDSSNWATGVEMTDKPCDVHIDLKEGQYTVRSSLFPHPIPLALQMRPDSDFYIGVYGEEDVFVLQQHPRGVSFTHTVYDSKGTLVYGNCGEKPADFIKECHSHSENP